MRIASCKMSPKDAAAKLQRAAGSHGPRGRSDFILPEPLGIVTLVTRLPRCRLGLSAQELHIDALHGTRYNYIFLPVLINLSAWSRAEFNLDSECVSSTHSAVS